MLVTALHNSIACQQNKTSLITRHPPLKGIPYRLRCVVALHVSETIHSNSTKQLQIVGSCILARLKENPRARNDAGRRTVFRGGKTKEISQRRNFSKSQVRFTSKLLVPVEWIHKCLSAILNQPICLPNI